MRRLLPRLALAAACCATAATQAQAQDGMQASRFDLGLYIGGSFTSRWFDSHTITLNTTPTGQVNDDERAFKPGYGPMAGLTANFWMTPMFGLRAHGGYAAMPLPFASDGFFDVFAEEAGNPRAYEMNTYLYDLSLAVRPFVTREGVGPLLRSVYLFAGGGGLTTDIAGEDRNACQPGLRTVGACLSYQPRHSTVGQGTAGGGITLIPFSPGLGLFGEAGVHVYDSPVHTGDQWLGIVTAPTGTRVPVADDRVAVTTRLVIGLKGMFGNILPPPPVVAPPPPPMVAPPPPPTPPAAHPMRDIQVCVVENGMLRNVTAQYNTQTGDTTWSGGMRPTMTGYAAGATWFINNEPVTVMGRRYVKYGLPRVLGVNEVTRVGEYQGVSLFAEAGATGTPEVLYVPVRPGCEFQPYQTEVKAGAVRGE